ncbi:MAG TPA: SRPBCC family protein [Devosiaceae bacterium]|nr:SRPBCC family protein [Devosiaceae bacterium]
MNAPLALALDPKLDLVLERTVDVPPDLVWRAWTEPELLKQWFVPRPWTIKEVELDLRPGGVFRSVMRSPEGQDFPNTGCVLDVVPKTRLVFTEALGPGYRPLQSEMPFTAVIDITPDGKGGTHYVATAIHRDDAGRKQHEEMGFHQGWGTAFDQLVEVVRGM